jgi:hypothetical protein
MMRFSVAVVRWGKIVEIIMHSGKEIRRDKHPADATAQLVRIDGRPDLRVGDSWPPGPDPKRKEK